jgi:hypothetical protein
MNYKSVADILEELAIDHVEGEVLADQLLDNEDKGVPSLLDEATGDEAI